MAKENTQVPQDESQFVDPITERIKLDEFRDHGIDISILDELLLTDLDEYQNIKINILKNILEGRSPKEINDMLYPERESVIIEDERSEEEIDLLLVGGSLTSLMEEEIPDVTMDQKSDMEYHNEEGGIEKITETSGDIIGNGEISEQEVDFDSVIESPRDSNDLSSSKSIYNKERSSSLNLFTIIGVGIIILLLIASGVVLIGGYNIEDDEIDPPDARFDVSDHNIFSGSIVVLSSLIKNEEHSYKWRIEPSHFTIYSGTMDSNNLTIYFNKGGQYNIFLDVSDEESISSHSDTLTVTDRTVRVSRESYGDISSFDVEGSLYLGKISSFIPGKEKLDFSSLYLRFWTDLGEPMITSVSSSNVERMDGFALSYDQMERRREQKMRFTGELKRVEGGSSPVTGYSDMKYQTAIDLFNKRPVRIDMDSDTHMSVQLSPGKTAQYILSEKNSDYPDMRTNVAELRIEDLSPDRTFTSGDFGTVNWGFHELSWEAKSVEILEDRPCILVDLDLGQESRDNLKIKNFKMRLWISDSIPVAARTCLNISTYDSISNPYRLNYTQNLITFSPGEGSIIFGSVECRHDPVSSIESMFPDLSEQFHNNWTYVPMRGDLPCTIPAEFDAEDAIREFEGNILYQEFRRENPDQYGISTNFTHLLDTDQWRFSLAEKNSERAWNQTVRKDKPNEGYPTTKYRKSSLSRDDIESILTYSGCEQAVKYIIGSMDQDAGKEAFGSSEPGSSNKIDMTEFAIKTEADHYIPGLGILYPSLIESMDCCYIISSLDGALEIGLNMQNGQISYIHRAVSSTSYS